MDFTNENFGVKVLETITAGLYDGNLNCLREYVQNSCDSRAKNIEIFFENGRRDIVIKDDGHGMGEKELKNSLDIGKSNKTEKDIGWRGIGIWSGIPICRKIIITTKKKGQKKFRLEIDSDALRKEFDTNKTAVEVLSNVTGDVTEVEQDNTEQDISFTIIRLESLLPTQAAIFNNEDIYKFLSRVVPVQFNEKTFSFAKKINKFLETNGITQCNISIKFEGENIYRPPFNGDIFFPILITKEFGINGKKVAVGWFLSSKNNRILSEPNRGIFFKIKGVTLGEDELLAKNLLGKTYHEWQYGEVHILSKDLRENAPRNNFEANSPIIGEFLECITEFLSSLESVNHYQSDKVVTPKVEKVGRLIEEGDIPSARKEINRLKAKLEKTRVFPKDSSLTPLKKILDSESEKNMADLNTLEKKLSRIKPDNSLKQKREMFDALINNLSVPIRNHAKKFSSRGRLEPEIDLTQPLVALLKQKTGLKENEVFHLSQKAFGWADVTQTVTPSFLTITAGEYPARDQRFGVMVYALHDLIVNASKHEKGKERFKWFDKCTDEEKIDFMMRFYSAVDLIYKIIEKSEPNPKK